MKIKQVMGLLMILGAIIIYIFTSSYTNNSPTNEPVKDSSSSSTSSGVDTSSPKTENSSGESSPTVAVPPNTTVTHETKQNSSAIEILEILDVKGRAPKTGYARVHFGDGWTFIGRCDTRNQILKRDLSETVITHTCKVQSGILNDPYTGTTVSFVRGKETSAVVQIDHIVSLSNAWQTGAQLLSKEERIAFANDPMELLAVDGNANQAKGDGDAATWLPANKSYRCDYVSRQISVKAKYKLWVTPPEKAAMLKVLESCPEQTAPIVDN